MLVTAVRATSLSGPSARLSWIAQSTYCMSSAECINRWNLWILEGGSSKCPMTLNKNLTFSPCIRYFLRRKVTKIKCWHPYLSEQSWYPDNPQLAWHTSSSSVKWQLKWDPFRVGYFSKLLSNSSTLWLVESVAHLIILLISTSTSALLPLKGLKFVLSGKMNKVKY